MLDSEVEEADDDNNDDDDDDDDDNGVYEELEARLRVVVEVLRGDLLDLLVVVALWVGRVEVLRAVVLRVFVEEKRVQEMVEESRMRVEEDREEASKLLVELVGEGKGGRAYPEVCRVAEDVTVPAEESVGWVSVIAELFVR